MERDRWEFIRRNRTADATADLAALDVPALAPWGEKDLNVDAAADAAIYRAILSARRPANRIVVIPDAAHGLLKAGTYNYQLVDQWPLWAQASFLVEGRFAYAPGALDAITGFIEQVAAAGHGHAHSENPPPPQIDFAALKLPVVTCSYSDFFCPRRARSQRQKKTDLRRSV